MSSRLQDGLCFITSYFTRIVFELFYSQETFKGVLFENENGYKIIENY